VVSTSWGENEGIVVGNREERLSNASYGNDESGGIKKVRTELHKKFRNVFKDQGGDGDGPYRGGTAGLGVMEEKLRGGEEGQRRVQEFRPAWENRSRKSQAARPCSYKRLWRSSGGKKLDVAFELSS